MMMRFNKLLLVGTFMAMFLSGGCRSDTAIDQPVAGTVVRGDSSLPDAYPIIEPNPDAPKQFRTIVKAAETNGIRITAAINRSNVIDRPILLSLTLKNERAEDVFLNHVSDESDFFFFIVDQDNCKVSETQKGKEWLGAGLYSQTMKPGMILHPDQIIFRTYDLKRYFNFIHPGPYKLEVVRTVNGTSSYPNARRELEAEINSLVFGISE